MIKVTVKKLTYIRHISFNHCFIVTPAMDAWADKAIAPIDTHITTVLFYMQLVLEMEENQG